LFSRTCAEPLRLSRRNALLMPLALAACGGEEEPVFTPLRYDYLPPIQVNVATIDIEQRFIPSGFSPDVTAQDPVTPVAALTAMAQDRLKPFGTAGKAVFAILDASLTRQNDVINAVMSVSLTVYGPDGTQGGYAEARIEHRRTGGTDDLRDTLYDITKTMMDQMNVEFEYQIRQHLRDWLTQAEAPAVPVEQAPLDGHSSDQPVQPQPLQPPDQPHYLQLPPR
jgi:hypothetical protein